MKTTRRPFFLDVRRIRLPLSGWVSILHRASGALLFLAVPAGVGVLSNSLSSEAGFARISTLMQLAGVKLALVVLVWAFSHHLFAGLRHLALDVHWGIRQEPARRTSVVVLAASAAVTLVFAGYVFR